MTRNTILGILFLMVFLPLSGQDNFVKENYEKSEYRIEMRDGIRLYTIVYTPKDNSEPYPILMQRTPTPSVHTGTECAANYRPTIGWKKTSISLYSRM